MDLRLEVVVVPVSDVDRAKAFYAEKMGFNVDVDQSFGDKFRVVQLTPPNSACSITFMEGMDPGMKPGSLQGLQITTSDLVGTRKELLDRGVEVSEIQTVDQEAGKFVPLEGPPETFNAFAFFSDPDGNGWAIQQGPTPG
ncbi:MAG TPA: VOC family protein [Actinomycetota bacterium]|nr:VOC family protein [Actinomycetota bacterium]